MLTWLQWNAVQNFVQWRRPLHRIWFFIIGYRLRATAKNQLIRYGPLHRTWLSAESRYALWARAERQDNEKYHKNSHYGQLHRILLCAKGHHGKFVSALWAPCRIFTIHYYNSKVRLLLIRYLERGLFHMRMCVFFHKYFPRSRW